MAFGENWWVLDVFRGDVLEYWFVLSDVLWVLGGIYELWVMFRSTEWCFADTRWCFRVLSFVLQNLSIEWCFVGTGWCFEILGDVLAVLVCTE